MVTAIKKLCQHILKGKLKLKQHHISKLRPHKHTIRKIAHGPHKDIKETIQTGAGIGGFLKNMFTKYVVPIGKSFLKQSYEIAKPELQKMGKDLTSAAVDYGTRQVKSAVKRGRDEVDKVTRKMRKQDALD